MGVRVHQKRSMTHIRRLGFKYSRKNCLNFNALNDIKVVLRLQAVLKRGNSEYTRYIKV